MALHKTKICELPATCLGWALTSVAPGDLSTSVADFVLMNGYLLRVILRECRTSLSANCSCWLASPMSVSVT